MKSLLFLTQKIVVLAICMFMTACSAIQDVKPWEKGNLAKKEMTFEGDILDNAYVEHTYFSKEAASGGGGIGGGGCGCN
ncbi:MAG: DUF4266 domain-containing protein [Methylococcaceae bacterium]|nr:DUF4266 domain-containing protein [Methylococcaceae bacterium]